MSFFTRISPLFIVGALGCTRASTDIEGVADVLSIVNERSRDTHISEFVTSSAGPYEFYPGHFENAPCPIAEDTYSGQFEVRSEVKREETRTTVQAWNQEWHLSFSCAANGRDSLSTSLAIMKTQSNDGRSGSATIEGYIDGGRGATCDVSMTASYEPATGEVLSVSGTICGKDISEDAALFVVPGFQDEHLIARY